MFTFTIQPTNNLVQIGDPYRLYVVQLTRLVLALEFGHLQSGCLDLSLGICKVVVWTRVWDSAKWLFGLEFGYLQSGCLDVNLGICKVVVWTRVWASAK